MKNPEDFWEVIDVVQGDKVIQPANAFGCKLGSYT
jgi:hypothetical protein